MNVQFTVTWSLRNHSDMQIWCSRNWCSLLSMLKTVVLPCHLFQKKMYQKKVIENSIYLKHKYFVRLKLLLFNWMQPCWICIHIFKKNTIIITDPKPLNGIYLCILGYCILTFKHANNKCTQSCYLNRIVVYVESSKSPNYIIILYYKKFFFLSFSFT